MKTNLLAVLFLVLLLTVSLAKAEHSSSKRPAAASGEECKTDKIRAMNRLRNLFADDGITDPLKAQLVEIASTFPIHKLNWPGKMNENCRTSPKETPDELDRLQNALMNTYHFFVRSNLFGATDRMTREEKEALALNDVNCLLQARILHQYYGRADGIEGCVDLKTEFDVRVVDEDQQLEALRHWDIDTSDIKPIIENVESYETKKFYYFHNITSSKAMSEVMEQQVGDHFRPNITVPAHTPMFGFTTKEEFRFWDRDVRKALYGEIERVVDGEAQLHATETRNLFDQYRQRQRKELAHLDDLNSQYQRMIDNTRGMLNDDKPVSNPGFNHAGPSTTLSDFKGILESYRDSWKNHMIAHVKRILGRTGEINGGFDTGSYEMFKKLRDLKKKLENDETDFQQKLKALIENGSYQNTRSEKEEPVQHKLIEIQGAMTTVDDMLSKLTGPQTYEYIKILRGHENDVINRLNYASQEDSYETTNKTRGDHGERFVNEVREMIRSKNEMWNAVPLDFVKRESNTTGRHLYYIDRWVFP